MTEADKFLVLGFIYWFLSFTVLIGIWSMFWTFLPKDYSILSTWAVFLIAYFFYVKPHFVKPYLKKKTFDTQKYN